jgi:hypothetical protein
VAYQSGASVCPQCSSSTDVRTADELFSMLNAVPGQGIQRLAQMFGVGTAGGAPGTGTPNFPSASAGGGPSANAGGGPSASVGGGPSANAGGGPSASDGASPPAGDFGPNNLAYQPGGTQDGGYDHNDVEGSDPRLGRSWNRQGNRDRGFGLSDVLDGDNLADDIGGAVLGAALGFAGRKFGKRMMKALEERVVPAVQARAEQAMQQRGQQQPQPEQDAILARYPELRGCLRDRVVFLDGGTRTVSVSELTLPLTLAQADAVVARLR